MPIIPEEQDAFGKALLDHLEGYKSRQLILKTDDGSARILLLYLVLRMLGIPLGDQVSGGLADAGFVNDLCMEMILLV